MLLRFAAKYIDTQLGGAPLAEGNIVANAATHTGAIFQAKTLNPHQTVTDFERRIYTINRDISNDRFGHDAVAYHCQQLGILIATSV